MKNPFPYSDDNKRYRTLAWDFKRRFGRRVFKAAIDGGFTCPNLDGSKGTGGCIFCLNGSGDFTAGPAVPVKEQVVRELRRIRAKHPGADAIAYFQVHTNTYASLSVLKQRYESALSVDGVYGLSIATRADALTGEVLDYLEELSQKTDLTVELGLQTIHEKTAERMNRCHTTAEFYESFRVLKRRGVRVCVHLIDGLPGETEAMMLETAEAVGDLAPDGVKIHLLHILEGTALAREYRAGRAAPLEKAAYLSIVCSQLERLPPETTVERLTGDGPRDKLLAPLWSLDKISVLGGIDRELARRDSWQGKKRV